MNANQMTIEQAAQVVMGTKPTSAVQLDEARAVLFYASRQGYKFSTDYRRGSAANPCIVVTPPANASQGQGVL